MQVNRLFPSISKRVINQNLMLNSINTRRTCVKNFLKLLQGNEKKVDNAIYNDFLTHLEGIESAVNQFLIKDLTLREGELAWNDDDRRGFFMHLYEIFSQTDNKANWSYVANPSGGFFAFYWNYEVHAKGDYWTYLQLEGDKLRYKIGFSNDVCETANWKARGRKIKSTWSAILTKLDTELTDKSTKIGKTTTIAKKADGTRYLIAKADGTLALEKTLGELHKAQAILKEARRSFAASEQQ